jgi:hypothetical protein
LVKGHALLEIVDVDVDQKLHCTRSFYPAQFRALGSMTLSRSATILVGNSR